MDDSRLYTVTASWPLTGLNEMPKPPYVITAYDCASGEVDWTFTPVSYTHLSWIAAFGGRSGPTVKSAETWSVTPLLSCTKTV